MKPEFIQNDGGRSAAGFLGTTGDCVCRAIAIASNKPYKEIYDMINELSKCEPITKRMRRRSNARTGVYKSTYVKIIHKLGGRWIPCMSIGSGCTVHLTPSELPNTGRHILRVSKHFCAWIDGKLHDTYDCSREGTRCVYGYWSFKNNLK
jgi:hypothetical protein